MLTGEPPFTGATAQAVIAKRFVSPIPKVRVTRDVPEALDDALTRVLSRTPVDRFATGAQFVEALRQVSGVGGSSQATVPTARTPPASAVRKAIAVLFFFNDTATTENE